MNAPSADGVDVAPAVLADEPARLVQHAAFAVGQRARLLLDDSGLRRAAWRGYGLAWLGLVSGAVVGAAAGAVLGRHGDLLTLAGLLAGTFAAVRFSKRHLPEPRLDAAVPDASPSFTPSDRP